MINIPKYRYHVVEFAPTGEYHHWYRHLGHAKRKVKTILKGYEIGSSYFIRYNSAVRFSDKNGEIFYTKADNFLQDMQPAIDELSYKPLKRTIGA